jgi:hypothetical protein
VKEMAKSRHYVFSARTTREGLRQLNDVKRERGVSWDELVIDAVCAHYGLDRSTLALPKAEKTPKVETKAKAKPKPKTKAKAKARPRALTEFSGAAEEPEAGTTGAAAEG